MSYQELDIAASRIAGLLSARGFGPDDLVAVCLERDPMLVAALLGIAQSGAAYLPIDPGLPAGAGQIDPRRIAARGSC